MNYEVIVKPIGDPLTCYNIGCNDLGANGICKFLAKGCENNCIAYRPNDPNEPTIVTTDWHDTIRHRRIDNHSVIF